MQYYESAINPSEITCSHAIRGWGHFVPADFSKARFA